MKYRHVYSKIVTDYEAYGKSYEESLEKTYSFQWFSENITSFSRLKSQLIWLLSNGGVNHLSGQKWTFKQGFIDLLKPYSLEELESVKRISEINIESHKQWFSDLPLLKAAAVITILFAMVSWIARLLKGTFVGDITIAAGKTIATFLVSGPEIITFFFQLFSVLMIAGLLIAALSFLFRSSLIADVRSLDLIISLAIEDRKSENESLTKP